MIAYSFDKETKEFNGTQVCQIDPIASKKQGKEVFLLPANCTFDVPLEKQEGKAIVYENGWIYKSDYRGKQAYNAEHIFVIDYIGDLKEGDTILTQEQIDGLNNGTLIFKDGQIIKYVKSVAEQIAELEEEIEVLNSKILRDLIILNDVSATEQEKQEAQTYFNKKKQKKNELIKQINALKN